MASWTDQVFKWLGFGRYKASPTPVGDGQVTELLTDSIGRLLVAGGAPPVTAVMRQLQAAHAGAILAAPGRLVELGVWNKGASGYWLMLFDTLVASPPSAGNVPLAQLYVPAGATLGWRPVGSLTFATGIYWALSTTPGSFTATTNNDVGFEAGYL